MKKSTIAAIAITAIALAALPKTTAFAFGGPPFGPGFGGGGGGGGGAQGAPLPLLGGTLFGQVALLGGGYLAWRRRRKNKNKKPPKN